MWLAIKRNAHDEFAGRRVAGGVGSMSLCARRALLAVGGLLPWLAPGVSLVIAVVSRNLVGSIEMLYDKALLEARIRSHTGQVFDQQFGPGLIYAWSALATLVTLVVVVLVERHLRRSQGRRRGSVALADRKIAADLDR
jgi:hypothetical protein